MAGGNGSALEVPDVLTAQDKARVLVQMLRPLQGERFELDVVRESNGASEDDPVPGLTDNGKPVTFAQRRDQIVSMERRIFEAADPEVRDFLDTALKG